VQRAAHAAVSIADVASAATSIVQVGEAPKARDLLKVKRRQRRCSATEGWAVKRSDRRVGGTAALRLENTSSPDDSTKHGRIFSDAIPQAPPRRAAPDIACAPRSGRRIDHTRRRVEDFRSVKRRRCSRPRRRGPRIPHRLGIDRAPSRMPRGGAVRRRDTLARTRFCAPRRSQAILPALARELVPC